MADVPEVRDAVLAQNPGASRTVERALHLLATVCRADSISLAECARAAQLPTSTALRLLRTLESAHFVSRGADSRFRAGPLMIQFGAQALGRQSLVTVAEPSLRRIVERTGESAYLVIRGPARTAMYIAMVEGTHAIRHTSWVGRAIALEDLAVGRALDGDVPASGYLAQRDRLEPDVTAIAAPIRWPGGVIAALNLLGPTYRIDESAMHGYGAIVAAEARAISTAFAPTAGPSARARRNELQEASAP